MAKEIQLSRGYVALVDDDDFDFLSQWKWCFDGRYASRVVKAKGKQTLIRMHRVISGASSGEVIDHANGDKLDNRRANLRRATHSQNSMNSKVPKDNKSGVKGVFWNTGLGRWQASICLDGKRLYLGVFKDVEEARLNRRCVARILFGEFACEE